ncbi:MAG: hypothetical protein JWO06_2781 [Bacteroidota bacterium]|nr:hypothetical protein [Bacteroidota bacterium]
MKVFSKFLFLLMFAASLYSCKKEAVTNNFIADWIKSPVSPGGNSYLKIKDNTNFETGYTVGSKYTQTAIGTYIYTASQITFYNAAGPFNPCSNVPGTYQYKVANNQFILTLISDGCIDSSGSQRSNILAGTWTQ